eukprot:GHVS01012868.1.p1 GENE.GHVS01012868.1~~GHVS01012868.1.p1  ORF type:complete len:273 (+),score=68.27 GHVS01012868.1:492-1310(+)
MSLIYAVVACGKNVLAEHTESTGNFITLTRLLLSRLPPLNSRSYVYDDFIFHCICRKGISYIVLADKNIGFGAPFRFLEDVAWRFESTYSNAGLSAIAYAMNDSFKPVLAQLMEYHQNHPDHPQLYQLHNQIDHIQDTMTDNIDKLMQREERIELLVNRTSHLTDGTVEFRRQAGKLRRAMWWRSVRYFFWAGVVLVLLVVVVAASRCGGWTLPQCRVGGGTAPPPPPPAVHGQQPHRSSSLKKQDQSTTSPSVHIQQQQVGLGEHGSTSSS